jgi:hypothetical protein
VATRAGARTPASGSGAGRCARVRTSQDWGRSRLQGPRSEDLSILRVLITVARESVEIAVRFSTSLTRTPDRKRDAGEEPCWAGSRDEDAGRCPGVDEMLFYPSDDRSRLQSAAVPRSKCRQTRRQIVEHLWSSTVATHGNCSRGVAPLLSAPTSPFPFDVHNSVHERPRLGSDRAARNIDSARAGSD